MKYLNIQNVLKLFTTSLLLITFGSSCAMGKLKVEKQLEINAAPETVWKMIGDYNHLDVWHPVVVGSTVSGKNNMPGAVRVLTLADGAKITEELITHNNDGKTYTYSISESPLPISNYISTIKVETSDNGTSLITWSSDFNAKDVDDVKAMEIISGIYDAGLGNLSKHFSK